MNRSFEVIAGPCSVNETNIKQLYEIAKMSVNGRWAVGGLRVVGLKSRTAYKEGNPAYMGMDALVYERNLAARLYNDTQIVDMEQLPSLVIGVDLAKHYGIRIATEIMDSDIQLGLAALESGLNGLFVPWNPSANQLGFPVLRTARMAARYGWTVGIKNGKWIGAETNLADDSSVENRTPIEDVWNGLAVYADLLNNHKIMIHRGFDVPEKGDHRNLPLHNMAAAVKARAGECVRMFYDPSHALGPKMRDQIVANTVLAAQMRMPDGSYIYDGLLIEAGDSTTDTDQHVTLAELEDLIIQLSKYRDIVTPTRYN